MKLDNNDKPLTMLQEQLTTAKKKQQKGRIKAMAIAGAVIPVTALLVYQLTNNKTTTDDQWLKNTTVIKRGTIDLTISASGTVRPVHEVKISPKVTGLIKRLLVEQGAKVKKGDMLALMDDSNLVGQVDAAKSAMNLAEAAYDKAVNGNRPQEIAQAEAQVHKAEDGVTFAHQALNRANALVKSRKEELIRDKTNAGRMTQLASEGAVSDQERLNAVTLNNVTSISLEQATQELRQAEATLAQAKSEAETARQQYSLLKAGSREEDIRAAQHEMKRARGQLNYLQSQLNDTRIRAPFSGIISQKYADEGAIVTPTTASATTSATSSSIVSLAGDLEVVA
ncbi:MAG: biotin/lipoyl-binding protein, partial [Cyanobacteria bacterium]|nr:biotin/lipoyl-binding protein [Cyanobacteriota bacterium]